MKLKLKNKILDFSRFLFAIPASLSTILNIFSIPQFLESRDTKNVVEPILTMQDLITAIPPEVSIKSQEVSNKTIEIVYAGQSYIKDISSSPAVVYVISKVITII